MRALDPPAGPKPFGEAKARASMPGKNFLKNDGLAGRPGNDTENYPAAATLDFDGTTFIIALAP
jgi:hypothetical protein